jgi:hypothetical protein
MLERFEQPTKASKAMFELLQQSPENSDEPEQEG